AISSRDVSDPGSGPRGRPHPRSTGSLTSRLPWVRHRGYSLRERRVANGHACPYAGRAPACDACAAAVATVGSSDGRGVVMSIIKPRTRGKEFVPYRTRLDRENHETLHAYAAFIGEDTDYLVNAVIDTVLAKDK